MNLGDNDRFHISIDKIRGHLKRLAKDVEVAVATYKSEQNDVSIRDILKYWDLCIWAECSDWKWTLFDHL